MLHSEVIIKYLGKYVDYDHAYWVQCTDWARQYCLERGYPIKSFSGSAYNWWKTGSPFDDSWIRITYKPWMFPKQGDIIFWNEWRCKYWHVAVCWKHCTEKILRCTDTNWKWKWDPVTPRFYNYDFIEGWYHKP